jgi:hypothetical protein
MAKVNFNLADKNAKRKVLAKKLSQAKKAVKCHGNMTPSRHKVGSGYKVVCTPKNIQKSRDTKIMIRKIKKTKAFIIGKRKAVATKKFRSMS